MVNIFGQQECGPAPPLGCQNLKAATDNTWARIGQAPDDTSVTKAGSGLGWICGW